jgi:hypothetical protein
MTRSLRDWLRRLEDDQFFQLGAGQLVAVRLDRAAGEQAPQRGVVGDQDGRRTAGHADALG